MSQYDNQMSSIRGASSANDDPLVCPAMDNLNLIITLFLSSIVTIAVSTLFSFHLYLILTNQTTLETLGSGRHTYEKLMDVSNKEPESSHDVMTASPHISLNDIPPATDGDSGSPLEQSFVEHRAQRLLDHVSSSLDEIVHHYSKARRNPYRKSWKFNVASVFGEEVCWWFLPRIHLQRYITDMFISAEHDIILMNKIQ